MIRNANGNGCCAPADDIRQVRRALDDHRQRARPIPISQFPCAVRQVDGDLVELLSVREQHGQSLPMVAALRAVDPFDRLGIKRVCPKREKGIRREAHNPANPKHHDCCANLKLWVGCLDFCLVYDGLIGHVVTP